MRRLALAVMLAACARSEPASGTWVQSVVELPANAAEVVDAVAALPECEALCQGGAIDWRAETACGADLSCGGSVAFSSCTFLREAPARIEVVMHADAWEGAPEHPALSPLAHALCHVCGYLDGPDAEVQADACARRARLRQGSGCSPAEPASRRWTQATVDLPAHATEVVEAVASLPECVAVRQGGVIHWRSAVSCGTLIPSVACAYPFERPRRIEIVMRGDAWQGTPAAPEVSTLAHELCHICGYINGPDRGEAKASACAIRAAKRAGRGM